MGLGIGKSRLVEVLKTPAWPPIPRHWLTPCQCSPYHQNSVLYPIIDLLERVVLQFERDETPQRNVASWRALGAAWPAAGELCRSCTNLLSLPLGGSYAP